VPPRVLVTTRAGGRSAAPYDENNLALHVGDDPSAVVANRRRLAGQLGVGHVRFMAQAHGAAVAVVDREARHDDVPHDDVPHDDVPDGDVPDVDALVTASAGCAIAVLVADCVPVAVVGGRAVAVIHAGRRGVVAGVVAATVSALRALDDGPLVATIGPAICGRCYEVPAEMQAEVVAAAPAARTTTAAGTPGLDLPAAVRAQLVGAGVETPEQPAICTREDARFYSHRRDGVTGRFAMVAMLSP
jgi:YfiH family protein